MALTEEPRIGRLATGAGRDDADGDAAGDDSVAEDGDDGGPDGGAAAAAAERCTDPPHPASPAMTSMPSSGRRAPFSVNRSAGMPDSYPAIPVAVAAVSPESLTYPGAGRDSCLTALRFGYLMY